MMWQWAVALIAALIAGIFIGSMRQTPSELTTLTCRPSAPEKLTSDGTDVILYLGNSLVFDHDWAIAGTTPVNCGRQGQILADLSGPFPDITPKLIVLGFGTVELVRNRQADAAAFKSRMATTIGQLQRQYPQSDLLLLGVPDLENASPDQFNAALRDIADTSDVKFAGLTQGQTYDGIHLTSASYAPWHAAIEERLR